MANYHDIKYNVDYAGLAGALMPLATFTSDGSDATASFTSTHITSTYKEYLFVFNNIHSETDNQDFTFNASVDNGSNYNVTKTDTYFNAYHTERHLNCYCH